MSVTGKVLDALRQVVMVNEHVEELPKAVVKTEAGQANLRDRVIRIEALIEFTRAVGQPCTLPLARTGAKLVVTDTAVTPTVDESWRDTFYLHR